MKNLAKCSHIQMQLEEKNIAKGEREEKNKMNKRKTKRKKNPTLGNNGAIIIKENTFIAPLVFFIAAKNSSHINVPFSHCKV